MTRYAIGDVQGCNDELQALLARLRFSADRDRIYFVGDLVNFYSETLKIGSTSITVRVMVEAERYGGEGAPRGEPHRRD